MLDGISSTNRLVAEYEFPYLAHTPLEPLNTTVRFDGDRAEVWAGSQFQTVDQMAIAEVLGLKPNQITFHTEMAGGGFGRRATPDSHVQREAAAIAKHIRGHRGGAPIPLRDEPADVLGARIDEILQVGVVDEPGSAGLELACGLSHIRADRIRFGVHQRIEAEDELDAAVRQGAGSRDGLSGSTIERDRKATAFKEKCPTRAATDQSNAARSRPTLLFVNRGSNRAADLRSIRELAKTKRRERSTSTVRKSLFAEFVVFIE